VRSQLEVERAGERDERGQRGVRLFGGEESTYCLRLDPCPSGQVGLRQVEFGASLVERADESVDLVDPLFGLLVGGSILRILEPSGQVTLGAGARLSHDDQGSRNVCVTHVA
jgi:hypothetical protein